MTIPDSDAKYIAYSYYDKVIYEYDKYVNLDDDKEEFDKIIKNINTKRNNLNLPDKFFHKLHKILRNGNVFYGDVTQNYCSYVNYKLNEEIKNSYHLVKESNFDIFHTFVVNFNNERHNKEKSTCYGYIEYLNDDEYNKMEILIYLYNMYKQIKPHIVSDNDKLCGILYLMGQHYKNAVDKHEGDKNFFNKLEELKRSMEGNNWAFNDICPVRKYIKLPEPKPSKPIEDSEETKQPKTLSPDVSRSLNLPNSDAELGLHGTPGQQALSEPQDNVQRDHILGSSFIAGARVNSGSGQENISRHSSEKRGERGLQTNSGYSPSLRAPNQARLEDNKETYTSLSTNEFGTDRIMDTPEGISNVLYPNMHGIPQEGLMGKIQDAFSSISNYVEPVPLMGVSGGMGALFLLLRYTPVGTFFRGGRGRVHRIPRSFNGPFPGEFPNFQDYEGGYIGYGPTSISSLAE
ncbi:PIR protein [Plasmodium vivax]|uniref:VIR protein n=1 Tax=Plasmodium vivax TaxID=5855 RepID=A0A564ZNF4_PLAVI|nr:PIR protein [Plasmodium vivax]VUZ93224.1 PIR protein [Plasmodium vivax]